MFLTLECSFSKKWRPKEVLFLFSFVFEEKLFFKFSERLNVSYFVKKWNFLQFAFTLRSAMKPFPVFLVWQHGSESGFIFFDYYINKLLVWKRIFLKIGPSLEAQLPRLVFLQVGVLNLTFMTQKSPCFFILSWHCPFQAPTIKDLLKKYLNFPIFDLRPILTLDLEKGAS